MPRLFVRTLILIASLICAAAAQAQSYTYTIYFDADNVSATGCTVNSPAGPLSGIESSLAISISAGTPPTVNSVTRSSCGGGVMGAPIAEGTGTVNVGGGAGGATSIELSVALVNLALNAGTPFRLYVVAQSAAGSDVLLTTNGQGNGSAMLLTIAPSGGAIPTIGIPAALLLVVILLTLGARSVRRSMLQKAMLGLALLSGVATAAIFNWSSVTALATDPAGDSTSGESAIDLRNFFAAFSAPNAYFRIDVAGNLAPTPPTVSQVSPASGPTAGGTSVAITGTNFAGATAVKFGATAATAFTVNNATTITATAPAGSGTVDITVTAGGGTSVTGAADQYTYVAPPTVTQVSPTVGLTTGGTVVTITGTNLTGATAVKFGATAATTFTVNNATTITATAPAGSGTVDVTVATTSGGTSATGAADQFSYVTPTPTVSLTVAGDSVHLNGTTTASTVNLNGADLTAYPANRFGTVAKLIAAGTTSVVDSSGDFTLDASGNSASTAFNFGSGTVSGTDAASAAGITYTGVTRYITSTHQDTVTLSSATQNVTASNDGTTVNLGNLGYAGTLNFTTGSGGTDTINATVGGNISGATINGTSSSVAKIALVLSAAGTETLSTAQYNTITSTTGGSISFTGGSFGTNTLAFSDAGTLTTIANVGNYHLSGTGNTITLNNGAETITEGAPLSGGNTYNLPATSFSGSLTLGNTGNDTIAVTAGSDISSGSISSAGTTASLSITNSGNVTVSSAQADLFHNAPNVIATTGGVTMLVNDNTRAINLNAQENNLAGVGLQAGSNTVNISVGAASVNSGAAGFNQTISENGSGSNTFNIDNGGAGATIVGANDATHYVSINNFDTTSDNIQLTLSNNRQNNGEQNISDSGNDTITVGVNSVIVEEDLGALPGFTVFNATDLSSARHNILLAINASASTSGTYTFVIDSNQGAAIYEIHINSGAGTIDGIQLIGVVHGVGAFNLINHIS